MFHNVKCYLPYCLYEIYIFFDTTHDTHLPIPSPYHPDSQHTPPPTIQPFCQDIIKFLESEKRRRNTFLPVFLDIWTLVFGQSGRTR